VTHTGSPDTNKSKLIIALIFAIGLALGALVFAGLVATGSGLKDSLAAGSTTLVVSTTLLLMAAKGANLIH
jgi:hypothetical protein